MVFPIRCYTCNAMLAQHHPTYHALRRDDVPVVDIFARLAVHRMCCRRMFLGHVDALVQHPSVDVVLDEGGTVLQRLALVPRVVPCD